MEIHNRMINNIPSIYDRTEGSFFYDATRPVAIEMDNLNKKIDSTLAKLFAETAKGEDLDRVCSTRAVYRKKATFAMDKVLLKGALGAKVKKGDMVASDSLTYIIQEDAEIIALGGINVVVKCEKSGQIGNVPTGAIKGFPVTLEGIVYVTNEQPFVNGYDEETDEDLRERYFTKIRTPGTSGNIYSYLNWAKEVTGCGDAKVYPLGQGPGTVKIVIVDSNNKPATPELIKAVKDHIDENRPVCSTVFVYSAVEKPIIIDSKIILEDGAEIEKIKAQFKKSIDDYFKSLSFKNNIIRISKIGTLLLSVPGVIDYSNLKLNGQDSNITVLENEIPSLNQLNFGV